MATFYFCFIKEDMAALLLTEIIAIVVLFFLKNGFKLFKISWANFLLSTIIIIYYFLIIFKLALNLPLFFLKLLSLQVMSLFLIHNQDHE